MVIKKLFKDKDKTIDTVCCIGFFDSVHRGHKKLIKTTVDIAKKRGIKAGLITFDKDPLEVIKGEKIKQVNTFRKRQELFSAMGIDILYVITFDSSVMALDPIAFIEELKNSINLKTLVCGFDFHFGYLGKGDKNTLMKDTSFETVVVSEELYYGKKISTTRIKNEITKGNMHLVNKLLGHNYSFVVSNGKIDNYDDLVIPPSGKYDVLINGEQVCVSITDDHKVDSILDDRSEVIFK